MTRITENSIETFAIELMVCLGYGYACNLPEKQQSCKM